MIAVLVLGMCACGGSEPAVEDDEILTEEEAYAEIDRILQEELWVEGYFVDEFNQPTDDRYVINSIKYLGTFNNSATTNSELTAEVLVTDEEEVEIFLYEYGDNLVKNNSSSKHDEYAVLVRDASGNKTQFVGYIAAGGNRVLVQEPAKIVELLKGTEPFSIYIEDVQFPTTNYLFEVKTANFNEVF